MPIRRTKGAADGFVLFVLGLWGALIPLVGPYFDYAIGADRTWNVTWDRFWLSILPGAAVALGGLILMLSRTRARAWLGAELALIGGIWFVVGSQVSTLWNGGAVAAGKPHGGTTRAFLEQIGFFYGLGALVVGISAFALGRLAVRSVRDAAYADEAATTAPAPTTSRFTRDPAPATDGATDTTDTTGDSGKRRRYFGRARL